MGLLGLFKGKDPWQQEEQGDRYFDASAFGQAKLEYEAALEKRCKDMPDDIRIPCLQDKILRCREALAREHKQRADDLAADGYLEDARGYYALALDLTQDRELIRKLEDCRQTIDCRQAEKFHKEISDIDESEPEIDAHAFPESDDEYTTALFNTLPDDVREAYLNYGPSFQNGYIALNQGQFEVAVNELSRALEENPATESFIRLELATAYLNLKRFEEARLLLEEFLSHHPDALPACRMLCEIYWEMGDFDRTQALLDSAPGDLRESLEYFLLCGETLFRAGKYPQAESFYRDFLRDYGWNEDIARALAGIYEASGDLNKAHELYGKIMEQCGGCNVHVDPLIKRKYADLSMATGIQNEKILEIYLSLAEQDPPNAAGYYHKVSLIYAALGHEKESQRFQLIALGYENDNHSAN
jgi:tetratricopeptide (TPR) repeat protein